MFRFWIWFVFVARVELLSINNESEIFYFQPETDVDLLRVCVSTSPSYVSTRHGPNITVKCYAHLCSKSLIPAGPGLRFEKPVFDWNNQVNHLLMSNSTCDGQSNFCWNKVQFEMEQFVQVMKQTGLQEIEIRCNVADYVKNKDQLDYVVGDSSTFVKYFKGKRIHEQCNQTEDCAQNMICSSSDTGTGYCECPGESLSMRPGYSKLTTFILVDDQHYHEQVCVETRKLNETCNYDQQCWFVDVNTYCKPRYSVDGLATSVSVCDCVFGYTESLGQCVNQSTLTNITETTQYEPSYGSLEFERKEQNLNENNNISMPNVVLVWLPWRNITNSNSNRYFRKNPILRWIVLVTMLSVVIMPLVLLFTFVYLNYRRSTTSTIVQKTMSFDNPNYSHEVPFGTDNYTEPNPNNLVPVDNCKS